MHALAQRASWSPTRTAFLPQIRLSGTPQSHPHAPTGPFLGGRMYTLGKTAQEWYEAAKTALTRYEFLKNRVSTVDNRVERENIVTWMGQIDIPGTPEYRYNAVKSDFISDVAREGVGAYNVSRRQNRVSELQDYNDELNNLIDDAIKTHGARETGIRTEIREVGGPDLTWPILGGAALVGLGLLLAL